MLKEFKNHWLRYGQFNISRLIMTGTDNVATYLLKKRPKKSPMYVGWNLTYRCNCFCSFCDTHRFAEQDTELTLDECKRITQELGKAGVVELTLSGGEPLMKEGIDEIIGEAKKYGINVNLATNGALLESKAELIIDAGIDSIGISLDSTDPETHNKNRQHKNLYTKIQNAIQKVKNIRDQKNSNKPFLVISSIVNKENYKQLDEFITYWKQYVDQVVLQPIQTGTPTSLFKISNESLSFSPEHQNDFNTTMQTLLKKHPELNNPYEREFGNFLFDVKGMYKKYKCSAGFFMLQIDAFGDVYPCTENIWSIGNLKKSTFLDILRGNEAHQRRDFIRKGENKCFCWYRCTGPFNTTLKKLVPAGRN